MEQKNVSNKIDTGYLKSYHVEVVLWNFILYILKIL